MICVKQLGLSNYGEEKKGEEGGDLTLHYMTFYSRNIVVLEDDHLHNNSTEH